MTQFDISSVEVGAPHEWPKRGRQATPIPEEVKQALTKSFIDATHGSIVLPEDQVTKFRGLLSRAGKELNYRIEHDIVPYGEGRVKYFFKANGKRNKEL